MIGLERASISLGGRAVLRDICFTVQSGEMVAVCGPNGAGKSTLLLALAGLLPDMPARDPRRVAYLPQGARCTWGLTVEQVAELQLAYPTFTEGVSMAAQKICRALGIGGFPQVWSYLGSDD